MEYFLICGQLLRGKHQYGYEVDVYSFGLIYFEIVYRDVRRNTDVIAWYEIMKYKRGDAEKPRQFTNLHPKQVYNSKVFVAAK